MIITQTNKQTNKQQSKKQQQQQKKKLTETEYETSKRLYI